MRNNIVAFFCVVILLISCNRSLNEQSFEFTANDIKLKSDHLRSALLSFMTENPCNNCLNKIYINKIYELDSIDYETIITIEQMPFNERNYEDILPAPLFKFSIDSFDFYIFSGIEDYFEIEKNKDRSIDAGKISNDFVKWTLIDKIDTLIVMKKGVPPYYPFPFPEEEDD